MTIWDVPFEQLFHKFMRFGHLPGRCERQRQ
jgi:hypothetical protein